jgi:hypothetical protein
MFVYESPESLESPECLLKIEYLYLGYLYYRNISRSITYIFANFC